jgi:8-oxo-dGTP diphosphatase
VVSVTYVASFEREQAVRGGDDADDARWFPVDALPPLAFDHAEVIDDALRRGRAATPPPA